MASTRALWAEDVEDLYPGRLDEVSRYLDVAQVSARTGLSTNTILDSLSRPKVTSETNVLGPLSRPAAHVGGSPLWSQEQVDESLRRQKAINEQRATGQRHLGGGDEALPTMTPDEADQRGFLSTAEIAEIAHMRRGQNGAWKSVHEQTVRRWARDDGDFPKAVALRLRSSGHPGVPIVLYNGGQVRAWLATKAPKIKIVESRRRRSRAA